MGRFLAAIPHIWPSNLSGVVNHGKLGNVRTNGSFWENHWTTWWMFQLAMPDYWSNSCNCWICWQVSWPPILAHILEVPLLAVECCAQSQFGIKTRSGDSYGRQFETAIAWRLADPWKSQPLHVGKLYMGSQSYDISLRSFNWKSARRQKSGWTT